MKLTVKTLKGGKFEVEVDESKTVAEVKGIIVRSLIGFARCCRCRDFAVPVTLWPLRSTQQ